MERIQNPSTLSESPHLNTTTPEEQETTEIDIVNQRDDLESSKLDSEELRIKELLQQYKNLDWKPMAHQVIDHIYTKITREHI